MLTIICSIFSFLVNIYYFVVNPPFVLVQLLIWLCWILQIGGALCLIMFGLFVYAVFMLLKILFVRLFLSQNANLYPRLSNSRYYHYGDSPWPENRVEHSDSQFRPQRPSFPTDYQQSYQQEPAALTANVRPHPVAHRISNLQFRPRIIQNQAANRPGRIRESSENFAKRRTVLVNFKCPFQEDNACRYATNPERCFFAHDSQSQNGSHLRNVPPYICTYYLINICNSSSVAAAALIGTTNTGSSNPRPCPNGLHPTLDEMLDLTSYERRHKADIRRLQGGDADRECGVCLEKILLKPLSRNRRFGILESCNHCFCSSCLDTWRTETGNFGSVTCPMCRRVSANILFRRRFIKNPEVKRNLFRALRLTN